MALTARFVVNWLCFFILGTINNISYVVVGSAAKSIAEQFGSTKYLGAIPWCNVALGMLVRVVNTSLCEPVPFSVRVWFNGAAMAAGALGLAAVCFFLPESAGLGAFGAALCAVLIIGGASSLGESVFLCYLKYYPARLVNAWASGTGMAGLAGALFYLVVVAALSALHAGGRVTNGLAFAAMLPLVAAYVLLYSVGLRRPPRDAPEPASNGREMESEIFPHKLSDSDVRNSERAIAPPRAGVLARAAAVGRRYASALRFTWWLALNLGLVYVFEYVISVSFAAAVVGGGGDARYEAPCSRKMCDERLPWLMANAYPVLAFCYQLGVFLSRSSLAVVKVRRVEILTGAQAVNFAFWMWLAYYPNEAEWVMYVLIPFMVFVGLMGGASYVNCFFLLLDSKEIPDEERELCVNLAAIAQTLGITIASLLMLAMNLSDFIQTCDCEKMKI